MERVWSERDLYGLALSSRQRPALSVKIGTGWKLIDGECGFMRPGKVRIFGARSNWGKSNHVVQITSNTMGLGGRVLIISLEDEPEDYGERLAALQTGLSLTSISKGELSSGESDTLVRLQGNASAAGMLVRLYDVRIEAILAAMRQAWKEVGGFDLVVLDYITLARGDGATLGEKVADAYQRFSQAVGKARCAGLVLSQLTQKKDAKECEVPDEESIRHTREPYHQADLVYFGWFERNTHRRLVRVSKSKKSTVPNEYFEVEFNTLSGCFTGQADVA